MTDATQQAGKITPVEMCGGVAKCPASPASYRENARGPYGYREPTKARIAEYALQQLEAARKKDLETHEKNLPALENNKAILARVVALMAEIGMPASFAERDRNSRARYPKTVRHDAGYVTDLRRECKADDGFAHATSTYERLKRDYDAYAAAGKAEAEAATRAREAEREAELKKRRADMALATILLRYGLPIESTWTDVLGELRKKHQRLDLAVAMRKTRGDWSDGPYRVSDALSRFKIENDEDKNIVADVARHLHDFDDGRCFRDTTWSYDALFASVTDRQLVDDVIAAYEHAEEC